MQAPSAPSPAPAVDARTRAQAEAVTLARLGLLFVAGVSPRSIEFAQRKLKEVFGHAADEADLRDAQQQLLLEATTGITALLRRGRS